MATWTSQSSPERSTQKKHARFSSRNPLNLTVKTGSGSTIKQGTKDISPSSSRSRSTVQPSVFDYTPSSPADSATTYEPASSTEDLVVTHPSEFQSSDLDTDTEFWYDGILPDDRSFPGAYDDSSFVRPFTPAEGLTPDLSFRDFPSPPSFLPCARPTHPEPRGSFRSSSQSKRSPSLRAAALRKSRSYDTQIVNPAAGLGTDGQWRESELHLSSLHPPKPLRISKQISGQLLRPVGGPITRKNSQRNGTSQRKCESNYLLSSSLTNRTSSGVTKSSHQESQLMHHILSTLQTQEDWEQDGDSIREHFARKPTFARSSGPGAGSRPRCTDDAMTARKRLLARLQGTDWRISEYTNTDTDADVEDLFGACAGHFRSVVSAALSLDSCPSSRGSRSFLADRGTLIEPGGKLRAGIKRRCEQDEVQWCDVIDLGEYFVDVDRS